MRNLAILFALGLQSIAGAAQAHPKLVSSSPAPDAIVARPARVALQFSEKLVPTFSGAEVIMTGHGSATHPPMKLATTTEVSPDGRTLVVVPKSPLATGRYSVAWHVVSADTHRISGNFAFAVK